MQKEETVTLTSVFVNNLEIRKRVYSFLNRKDRTELSFVNKKFNKLMAKDNEIIKKFDFEFYLKYGTKKTKKEKKCRKGKFSCNIYNFDQNWLAIDNKWTLLNETEKNNEEMKELLYGVVPHKFYQAYAWLIFYSPIFNKYFIVNRVLVDPTLQYFHKAISRDKAKNETTEIDFYDLLHGSGSDALNLNHYDNLDNGLLLRQKETLSKANAMQNAIQKNSEADILKTLTTLGKDLKKISVILCQGGSFSMGVFEGNQEITHKSDHRYVIRGKSGGRQMIKDKTKKIKSVGSQIRRENEKKHQASVNDILLQNIEHLRQSDRIFVHAPGENDPILFEEGKALEEFRKGEKMISVGSLCAKKANHTEVKRIYEEVMKIYVFDDLVVS